MKYISLILFLLFSNQSIANCISDLSQYWKNNNPNKGTAYSAPLVQDFTDLNNDGVKEKIVIMGGGHLGEGIIYIKDKNGCSKIIFKGSAEVRTTDYVDPKGRKINEFNSFKFLSDRSVNGCSGGNRTNTIYAFGNGKYNLVKRTEIWCLEHLKRN